MVPSGTYTVFHSAFTDTTISLQCQDKKIMDANMAISFLSVDGIWSQPDTTSQSDEFKYILLFS